MTAGHFDDDVDLDLAVATDQDNVSILLGNGNGTFASAPGSPFPAGGASPRSVTTGHFDDDTDLDLAIANVQAGCASYAASSDTFQFDLKLSRTIAFGEHTVGIQVSAPDGSGVVNTDSIPIVVR